MTLPRRAPATQAPDQPPRKGGSCLDPPSKTVRGGQNRTNPGRWATDLEYSYRRRLKKRPRLRWRTAALGRRDDRVASCARRRAWIECGCGRRQVGGCGVRPLCTHCGRQWRARLRRRALDALRTRYSEADGYRVVKLGDGSWSRRRNWRQHEILGEREVGRLARRRDWYRFVTLTVRHSQPRDIERDRERLQRAWTRFRAWFRRTYGYSHSYVGLWEVAPGADGYGHIHLHLIVLWPGWIDYGAICDAWRSAVGDGDAAPDIKPVYSLADALGYVLGYANKGLDVSKFSGAVAGDVMGVLYARRTVTTSRGFWLPRHICCQQCGQFWHVERPRPLRKAAPEVWWRATVWATLEPPGGPLELVRRDGAPLE